jgi:alanine dehydrogenase
VSGHPFAGRSTRVLGMQDIARAVSMRDAIEVQRTAFAALAAGRVTATPNTWLRLPDQERRRGWLKILAGHEAGTGALGVKVLARFADNPPGANLGSLIMLFDDENGFPVAIMDGVLITALRTGAGAGVASDLMAAPHAARIALIGTGVVGWHSLEAAIAVRPSLERVRVFSRSEERRSETAARAGAELGVHAEAVASVDEAVEGADIIITATNSPQPILHAAQLSPHVHLNAMGIRTELDPEILASSWVVPDGRAEAIEDGKFSVALAAGAVTEDQLGPQLGELVAGGLRRPAGRPSVFDSSGVVVQDLLLARFAFEQALAADAGATIDLGLETALV